MKRLGTSLILLGLAACASAPEPQPVPPAPPIAETPAQPVWTPPVPADFASLPGWTSADILPGLEAMRKSCGTFARRPGNQYLSDDAPWAGRVDDWMPACAALDVVADNASAKAVVQALFQPVEILSPDGQSRFTGYFEPVYEARYTPVHPYTEPVPALPADLVSEGGDNVYQTLPGGGRRAYPSRAEITAAGVTPLAYAHPGDVFFLQVQGSGKLVFPDGTVKKAVYAAHNGQPFRSTANWLLNRGWISRGEASMQGIRAWMDRATPAQVREAMNANPRFVFFTIDPSTEQTSGPRGALNVPLTPLGSMAVDRSFHALGVPVFVQTSAPGLGGEWSGLLNAQDTGGAIKGPVRGDIYFGTGLQAGERAGTMNAPGRLWVLLPSAVAARLDAPRPVASLGVTGNAH
ncbi:murein transglycosylase A [Henriciella pelagia]|jgi:membrane-bound lytic murein transglycosylase A|uniref:murein transglycosylase A n=1 Tax=Henriciella pelagia TaxID=1977912 RepID=UPI000A051B1F|nr:MltA domain-containing protein [Henriciella pelagia]